MYIVTYGMLTQPIEVKCHSPFSEDRRHKHHAHARFELRDPGPFSGVAVWHMPQL